MTIPRSAHAGQIMLASTTADKPTKASLYRPCPRRGTISVRRQAALGRLLGASLISPACVLGPPG